MQIEITGRHVEITPALRQLIERRLARVERMLNDSVLSCTATLTLEKYRHRVEINVYARGQNAMHGLGEGNAWNISVRQAMEKIEQQAKKIKGKWAERKRSDTRRRTPRTAAAETSLREPRPRGGVRETAPPEPAGPRVIRATRYAVKPMTVDDAAVRMEETADAFLVFRNADSDAVSIVYRRKDGNLGLIEPD